MKHYINFKQIGYLNKLDKQRKDALSSQDGVQYYKLCNKLGIDAEDDYLYEQGQLEAKVGDTSMSCL